MIDLNNDLKGSFKIGREADALNTVFTVPTHLTYFMGHFPENPILPAVAIVDISIFFLENLEGPGHLGSLTSLKVKSPIFPRETYLIEGRRTQGEVSRDRGSNCLLQTWFFHWKKNSDQQIVAELEIKWFAES